MLALVVISVERQESPYGGRLRVDV